MKSFKDLCKGLIKTEAIRGTPIDIDSLNESISSSNTPEQAFDTYVQSSVFEEYVFGTGAASTSLYPVPNTYVATDMGLRDVVDAIDPSIRRLVLSLIDKKKKNQSVVYSNSRKEAKIIDSSELDTFVKHGYIVIAEEASVAPTPTDGQFTNTNGSFDKVAGYDLPLFKKNKKELKKYKGKVFEVPSHIFRRLKEGHPRYTRWADYIHEEDDANFIDIIKNYSMRNPRSPIVIRNEEDGDMAIMRRRTNDARLKHNRSK